MVVLDVTRMSGEKVCVGGYLEEGDPIRPVGFFHGLDQSWLQPSPENTVVPFSVLDLFVGGKPEDAVAPHTEDRLVPPHGHVIVDKLPEADCREWLEWRQATGVAETFGTEIYADQPGSWGRYVLRGRGTRSLGTVQATDIEEILFQYRPERSRWEYRLRFRDGVGKVYQLAVVDLAFRRQLDALRDSGLAPQDAAAAMRDGLRGQRVYLRVGLARGWDRHPDRCYLQLTGVYGFAETEPG
jgi:hypothetical protein